MQQHSLAFLCTLLLMGCGAAIEPEEPEGGSSSFSEGISTESDASAEPNKSEQEINSQASIADEESTISSTDNDQPLDDPNGVQNSHFFNGYVVAEYSFTNLLSGETEFTTGYFDTASNALTYTIELQPSNTTVTMIESLDAFGRVKQVEQFNEEGELLYSLSYYYNVNGLPWLQRTALANGGNYEFQYYWSYTELQSIERIDINSGEETYYSYGWSGSPYEDMYRYSVPASAFGAIVYNYQRDEFGRVVSKSSYYANSGAEIDRWNYSYDANGNLAQFEKYTSAGALAEIHNISYQYVDLPAYNRELFHLKTFP